MMHDKELRPKHYKKGADSWAWAEDRFNKEQLIAIAEFNIHKYTHRDKGQNESDEKKILHYGIWLKKIEAMEDQQK